MFKLEELLLTEVWTLLLSKLSVEDELSCRCVCVSFKKEVDSILKKNQDRLWLRHRKHYYEYYFCCDKDHKIFSRNILYFDRTISIKNLKLVSSLMPSLKILQLDPVGQVYHGNYNEDRDLPPDGNIPNYRDKKEKAVPITKIFPQVQCFILSGRTEKENFVGDLSQVKHLTLFDDVYGQPPKFPNLDSLEVLMFSSDLEERLPMPSKRFVVPHATIKWRNLPKTLEFIETNLKCDEYISVGKPHFENLKILKGVYGRRFGENQNLETLINFLKDHKGSLTELSFSAEEQVANIKVLLLLLTQLQKLSVKIKIDNQAIELKEIKTLAYNLQYFELSFGLCSSSNENFGRILENLPLGLDNLSIEDVTSYGKINPFMEKIMEKIVNGDTARVTIADVYDGYDTMNIMENIVKMKPEPIRVEKRNSRIVGEEYMEEYRYCYFSRKQYPRPICDIVISL